MKLTLASVRKFTKRALKDADLEATIESIEWLGKRIEQTHRIGRCEYKTYWRTAEVILVCPKGRKVYKTATIESNNAFCIR